MTLRRLQLGAAAAATTTMLLLAGCQGSGSFAKLQETLAQISDKQDKILSRLDEVEQKVGKAGPAAPAQPERAQPARPDPKVTYKVPVNGAFTKGPDTAKVTIIEWSDFQCPFCKRVNPTIDQVVKDYGNDVRVAFKHNPLPMHNRAMPAALAAEAAGLQGKFWEMHDRLFENPRDLTDEKFEEWAKELGLDVEKFKKDMNDPAVKKKILDQQSQGSTLGARGTPAFFINGRFLSGAQPVDAFKQVIDEEMKKAEKLIASGTPPEKVYEKTIENGKTKV